MMVMFSSYAEPATGWNSGHTLRHPAAATVQVEPVAVSLVKKYSVMCDDGFTHAVLPETASESGRFPAGAGVGVAVGGVTIPPPPPPVVPPPPPPQPATAKAATKSSIPSRSFILCKTLLVATTLRRKDETALKQRRSNSENRARSALSAASRRRRARRNVRARRSRSGALRTPLPGTCARCC